MIKSTLLLAVLTISSVYCYSSTVKIYIDDTNVRKDGVPGCIWKHCRKKAERLRENYLKDLISGHLVNDSNISFSISENELSGIGVNVTIQSFQETRGRGVVEFATSNLTLGTAPIKLKVGFKTSIRMRDQLGKNKACMFWVKEKRNTSVVSDMQEYKKDAALKIYQSIKLFVEGDSSHCEPNDKP